MITKIIIITILVILAIVLFVKDIFNKIKYIFYAVFSAAIFYFFITMMNNLNGIFDQLINSIPQ